MRMHRLLRSRPAKVLGVGVLLAAVGVTLGVQQVRPPAPDPSVPVYQAWVPPGNYSAIVLSTSAKDRRWIVSIRVGEQSFPVAVPPGETTIVPFAGGWSVGPGDAVRIESQYLPFEDPTRTNLMGGGENLTASAWGITAGGPVAFRPPVKK